MQDHASCIGRWQVDFWNVTTVYFIHQYSSCCVIKQTNLYHKQQCSFCTLCFSSLKSKTQMQTPLPANKKKSQMGGPSVLTAPSSTPSGYILCLGDKQTAVGLQFPQSSETPTPAPATGEPAWTAAGWLAAPSHWMVPSQLDRQGMVGGTEGGRGAQGVSVWCLGQLCEVEGAGVMWEWCECTWLERGCLSDFAVWIYWEVFVACWNAIHNLHLTLI